MSLSNIKNVKAEKGFTIVELLIVIVVIGILAAIMIVSYNGVTNNARNSNNKSQAAELQKIAETVNAEDGAYPTGTTSALLKASFDSTPTTKIPSGVSIILGVPANNQAAIDAADDSNNNGTAEYYVDTCTTGGLRFYYPVRGGSLQTLYSGDTTSC